MAISKNQPMRQAEIDTIDYLNSLNLSDIESVIDDITDELTTIASSISTLSSAVSTLSSAVSTLDTRVSDLDHDVDAADGAITTMQGQVATLHDTVSANGDDILQLESQVTSNTLDIGINETKLNKVVNGNASTSPGTKYYRFTGSAAFVVIKRGSGNALLAIIGYYDSSIKIIGDNDSDVTFAKESTSYEFTVTTATNSKGILVSPNVTEYIPE